MKLKLFDSLKCGHARVSLPMISISLAGVVTVNKGLSRELNLHKGDRIAFYQNENRPIDWYLVKDEPTGFFLRDYKNGILAFSSSELCREVRKSLDVSCHLRIAVSTEPTDDRYYALITAGFKNKADSEKSEFKQRRI